MAGNYLVRQALQRSAGLTPSRPPRKQQPHPPHFRDGSIGWPGPKPIPTMHFHDPPRPSREREVREERHRLRRAIRRNREREAHEAPSGSGARNE